MTNLTYLSSILVLGMLWWDVMPGVVLDKGLIAKRKIMEDFIPGYVQRIQVITLNKSGKARIAILGQTGLWFLSCDDYHVIEERGFKDQDGKTIWFGLNAELVDVEEDGTFEIIKDDTLNCDFLDSKGRRLWRFDRSGYGKPEKMIVGDLDQDKNVEFYSATRNGLYQLDRKGKVNRKMSNDWILDINIVHDSDSGKLAVIALTHCGEFILFDYEGNILRRFKTKYNVRHFDIVNWPNAPNILIGLEGFYRWKMILINLKGEEVFNRRLGRFWYCHGPEGVAVKLDKNENPYLAVVAHTKWVASLPLTQLSIFSPSGDLIFQEVLKANRGLCAVRCSDVSNEVLLVGDGKTTVWEYSLKSQDVSKQASNPNLVH